MEGSLKNINIFNGPLLLNKSKKLLRCNSDNKEHFIPGGKILHIDPINMGICYFLNGLENNIININKKFNHLIIKNCSNLYIEMEDCAISGIDIIDTNTLTIKTCLYNYVNIEECENINLEGDINNITKILISKSDNINV